MSIDEFEALEVGAFVDAAEDQPPRYHEVLVITADRCQELALIRDGRWCNPHTGKALAVGFVVLWSRVPVFPHELFREAKAKRNESGKSGS